MGRTESVRASAAAIAVVMAAIVCLTSLTAAEARIRRYDWEVKYEFRSPDCYKKLVITVNGMSPGPTIKAHQGDYIIVRVKNSLITENLSVHWHGIRQIGSPWFDGTEGVTQCAVAPGEIFVYKFVVDRPGTYLYHAHYGMQREAGLFGMIQVDLPKGQNEPFSYDEDHSIILTDWWHKSTYEQSTGLSSIPFVWVGEPQSLLIQGRGKYNCSLLVPEETTTSTGTCNSTNPDCTPFVMDVIAGKTYRLRVASLTGLSALSFEIEGHNMTVVEADGHYVEPFNVTNLFIYSGETYSVLITTNQNPTRNYWITTNIVSRNPKTPTGLAILNYNNNNPNMAPPTQPTLGPIWNNTSPRFTQSKSIKSLKSHTTPPPLLSDRLIIFLNTQNEVNGNIRWSVNNVSFTLPTTPYLISMKHNLHDFTSKPPPPTGYDTTTYDIYSVQENTNATIMTAAVYNLDFNSTVDVILQNANTMTPNNSETHPWHLHGHDFWVLGYGEGKFDPFTDPGKEYNLVNPIMKNTVPVHPYGWTAIRFIANNPGVWLFHCHIESHFYMGMGVVFAEGVDKVGKLPNQVMGCGDSKRWFMRP